MENVKKLGKITSFTLIIILIASLTVNFPYDATAQEFRFKIPSGPTLTSVFDVVIEFGNIYATVSHNVIKFSPDGTVLLEFGSRGSGDGQFNSPRGIAVDGSGNIYVADGDRVQIFNSAGVFQSKFGLSGSGDGQFDAPQGIALDGSGNIYVADSNNHRIQKFNSDGEFQSKFGSLCDLDFNNDGIFDDPSPECNTSSPGAIAAGDGQFNSPRVITFDGSGNIYVADGINHRVQKFNSAGEFQSKFGSLCRLSDGLGCVDPDGGGGPLELGDGQFFFPQGIAFDKFGNIYVADNNNRIQKFNSDGMFLSKFGSSGSGDGQFSSPHGIAFDILNRIYVADTNSNRIQKLNVAGVFQSKFGSRGSGDDQFISPQGIALDGSGNIYVTDLNNRVQIFNSAGNFIKMFGWGVNGGTTFETCTSSCQAGLLGSGDGQFRSPQDIALDGSGNIYVADTFNDRVQKFNSDGMFLLKFGSSGSGDDQFNSPRGIAVDVSDNIYVADTSNHRIQIFNSVGVFQLMFGWGVNGGTTFEICTSGCQAGISGSDDGQFNTPRGIAVDSSDNIYVADDINHRVQKFNSAGEFQSKFGSLCRLSDGLGCVDPDGGGGPLELGDGQFFSPQGIAFDKFGNIYVADTSNHRVQIFNSDGVFQSKFGLLGSGDGQFSSPQNIALDSSGNIFVAETGNHRIQKFVNAPCQVPTMPVDMIIDEDCILSGIAIAPANVIVQSGVIMIISSSATLDINFVNNFLRIESGSGVLIKAGGAIT